MWGRRSRAGGVPGGQKQRVALARALAPQLLLLLLDESLSALVAQIRKRLQAKVGIAAVFMTHDQAEALVLADRTAAMQAGPIVQSGAPHEVYGAPANRAVAGFIGAINIEEACNVARLFGQTTDQAWALHPETIRLGDAA